ncbi:MAG: ankyrin repeat domain-containing protein [Fibrobacteria bacterium]|nr:ankyrin repeat domain-containing protein [Fibrobacteria bacterium]
MNDSRPDISEGIAEARKGDVYALRGWLARGGDPDAHDPAGWTPLLWAAARGHHEAVQFLLDNPIRRADPFVAHRDSGALPIHMAGQSGCVSSALHILAEAPSQLDALLDLNGHTALLQAVFYGHRDLALELARRGADTSITTARGLGPVELARQFQNQPMVDLLLPFDRPAEAKSAYYRGYLDRIAPVVPEEERPLQELADALVEAISAGIAKTLADPTRMASVLAEVESIVGRGADVNRLGGPLQQPALIVAVTGNNGLPGVPEVAALRLAIARCLLDHGADPTLRELHPMAAQTIIRAAVFNHLDILRECAKVLTPQRLADAINEYPAVNGLTAMHDTVLRATMAGPDRLEGYLDQARFFVSSGGRVDVEDFAGVTQRDIADRCEKPEVRKRLLDILDGKE